MVIYGPPFMCIYALYTVLREKANARNGDAGSFANLRPMHYTALCKKSQRVKILYGVNGENVQNYYERSLGGICTIKECVGKCGAGQCGERGMRRRGGVARIREIKPV